MIESLKSFIEKNKLFKNSEKLILAISGGVDSMVLLDLFNKLDYQLVICHVNHELRGEDSDQDEHFVASTAKTLELPYYVSKIGHELKNKKTGNLQEQARILRYKFFNEILTETESEYIVTAHHQDDQIETVIHNFFRGTGIQGLTGMDPKNCNIVRPLLGFSKSQIQEYAQLNNINFREDKSNRESKYARNKIRNELLPSINSLFPEADKRILTSIDNISDSSELFELLISKSMSEYLSIKDGHIEISKQITAFEKPISLLFHFLKPYGFSRTQCENILELNAETGKKIISDSWILVVERSYFKLFKPNSPISTTKLSFTPGETISFSNDRKIKSIIKNTPIEDLDKYDACLDLSKLKKPLIIRQWSPADKFKPLGLSGKSQNVSKALRNYKIEHADKAQAMVLSSAGEIVWLIPYRISEDFRITPDTKQALCITYEMH